MSQPVGDKTVETNDSTATPEQKVEPQSSGESTLSHEDALKELAKVRAEAASRRIANKDLEAQATKWREYEESQKSELQKLQDQLAERDKAVNEAKLEAKRVSIAKEFNVADEDLDLLVGDEDNMKRLAARLGKKETTSSSPADLLAGTRGKPVGNNSNSFSMEDFIRRSV